MPINGPHRYKYSCPGKFISFAGVNVCGHIYEGDAHPSQDAVWSREARDCPACGNSVENYERVE